MVNNAIVAQGFKLEIGNQDSPLTYTEVKGITSFQGFDGEASDIDITDLQSTAKEYLIGLKDNGNLSIECNYLTGDTGQGKMREAVEDSAIRDFKCTFSDLTTILFQGFVKSAPISGGVDDKLSGSYNIRISGALSGTAV